MKLIKFTFQVYARPPSDQLLAVFCSTFSIDLVFFVLRLIFLSLVVLEKSFFFD